jgi:hypothetical protein
MNLLGREESYMRRNSVYRTFLLLSQAQSKLNQAYNMDVGNKWKWCFHFITS